MSKRKIIECDRCGGTCSEHAADRSAWSQIYAATLDGKDLVGTAEIAADLCGDCSAELEAWMCPPPLDTRGPGDGA